MFKNISYLYVSASVILWGSTAAVAKLLLEDMSSLQILFYTSLISAISLFIIILFQKKLPLIRTYRKKDYWKFMYMGFIGIFLYYIFLFQGLTYAPAQEAFIVNYTWPIWVIIFAILILKEKIGIRKIVAILLGFIGVYFVATKGEFVGIENLKGDLFALAGAISYGLFSVLTKKHNHEKFTSMMFYNIFTFIFIAITAIFVFKVPVIESRQVLGLLWLGVMTSSLAHIFWFLALKYGDTAKMSGIIYLTPFVSLVYIYILLKESILISSVVGLIIIVAGIVLQSDLFRKKEFID